MRIGARQVYVAALFGLLSCCTTIANAPINVAASAAVPSALAPIVLQTFPRECAYRPPEWLTNALKANASASANRQAFALASDRVSAAGSGVPPA